MSSSSRVGLAGLIKYFGCSSLALIPSFRSKEKRQMFVPSRVVCSIFLDHSVSNMHEILKICTYLDTNTLCGPDSGMEFSF
jgi:hypothetical protein